MRKRPGMYMAIPVMATGLHHMVFEGWITRLTKRWLPATTSRLRIIHADNSVSVTDNGRGIPTAIKQDDDEALGG